MVRSRLKHAITSHQLQGSVLKANAADVVRVLVHGALFAEHGHVAVKHVRCALGLVVHVRVRAPLWLGVAHQAGLGFKAQIELGVLDIALLVVLVVVDVLVAASPAVPGAANIRCEYGIRRSMSSAHRGSMMQCA